MDRVIYSSDATVLKQVARNYVLVSKELLYTVFQSAMYENVVNSNKIEYSLQLAKSCQNLKQGEDFLLHLLDDRTHNQQHFTAVFNMAAPQKRDLRLFGTSGFSNRGIKPVARRFF